MFFIKNCLIIANLLLIFAILVQSKRYWTYELIKMYNNNETPDVLETDLKMIRISRGLYILNGTIDIKQDLTDDLRISVQVFYNPMQKNNFMKTPFEITEMTLTVAANTFYKNLFMETALECVENAPEFETKFEPPLEKRVLTFNNCYANEKFMPTFVRSGYYKIVIEYSNQASGSVVYIIQVK